ncbi:MAG: hypothetical protein ACI4T3_06370 [Lactobacillus sp.]
MKKKAIWAIVGSIIVIICCVVFVINKQKSNTAKVASSKSGDTGLVIKKRIKIRIIPLQIVHRMINIQLMNGC